MHDFKMLFNCIYNYPHSSNSHGTLSYSKHIPFLPSCLLFCGPMHLIGTIFGNSSGKYVGRLEGYLLKHHFHSPSYTEFIFFILPNVSTFDLLFITYNVPHFIFIWILISEAQKGLLRGLVNLLKELWIKILMESNVHPKTNSCLKRP